MASLPTPIATLQSQLHIFYDALILTFVIAIILLPRGVRVFIFFVTKYVFYSAYWHVARHDVDDAIALWP